MRTFRIASCFLVGFFGLISGEVSAQKKTPPGMRPPVVLQEVPPPPPPGISSFTLAPATLAGGSPSKATVTLSSGVIGSDVVINLSSSNPETATVPPNVTVKVGSSTTTFMITTRPVSASTPVTIGASHGGTVKSAQLKIDPAALKPLYTIPSGISSVVGGKQIKFGVALTGAAPTGGAAVLLTSSHPSILVIPGFVKVLEGAKGASFPAEVHVVSELTQAEVTAKYAGVLQTVRLKVQPPALKALYTIPPLNPYGLSGPQRMTFGVALNGSAPTGGAVVLLSFGHQTGVSGCAAVTLPQSVMVPEGAAEASFPVNIMASAQSDCEVRGAYGGVTMSVYFTLLPVRVVSIQLSPTSTLGGSSVAGELTLSGVLSFDQEQGWGLSSDNPAAVPSRVTVPASATRANFTVTTSPVPQTVQAKIFWFDPYVYPAPVSATLTINPPALKSFALNPTSASYQAGTVDGTITLTGPAAAGVSVPLSWTSTEGASAPSSVPVPEGQTTASFKVTLKPVTAPTPFTLWALYGGARMNATLTVNP